MRIPKVTRPGKEGVNCGFRIQDQRVLDSDYEANSPKIKVFKIPLPEEGEEDQLCSLCGSKMMRLERTGKIVCTYFGCGNEIAMLNTTPLVKTGQGMKPYQSQHYDPNNTEAEPYFMSYNPDSGNTAISKNYEVTYDNGRVKKIKCRGYPTDISINAFND